MGFKNYMQFDMMDCGPTCLKMISKHYGKTLSLDTLRNKTKISKNGVSLFSISEAAEEIGFNSSGAIVSFEQLKNEVTMPAILHWTQNHFVVVYKIRRNKVYISDPGQGNKVYTKQEFLKYWASIDENGDKFGIVLLLEPTPQFYELDNEKEDESSEGLFFLLKYFYKYRKELTYVFFAIGISSVLQFSFPFLTQAIVDRGIASNSSSIVFTILMAQFVLLLGRLFIEYMRTWFLLFINSRINVSILSDYLIKLMKLPVSYFDTRRSGDILQRMNDHQRIQDFLTGPAIELVFSVVTIAVLGTTLLFYNATIFTVFAISSVLYTGWTFYLLRYNTVLNFRRFELGAQNQTEILQIINGIQDIKLYNSEKEKRWTWEKIQSKHFKLNIEYLKYTQIQQSGAFLINEGKNLLITFIAAISVINGQFTLGMMLAVQAIVGQLNGPISLIINLIQRYHDTKLSLERLTEIRGMDDEEPNDPETIHAVPNEKSITLRNLMFSYPGTDEAVLKNISFDIPAGKTTAIVGASGSGKTTLIKLLLKFYESYNGQIMIGGNAPLSKISPKAWRKECGTVMQESYIFSDTIANNISLGEEATDYERLGYAIHIANIGQFIESLPLGVETKIGSEGIGISQGQKQRILIARAVYKDPEFIFFDEATNALDASNESIIIKNLDQFFVNRTVVVVAHRLSTVKNAHKIIVLGNGEIIESGTHQELTQRRGNYFRLVKDQLELGA